MFLLWLPRRIDLTDALSAWINCLLLFNSSVESRILKNQILCFWIFPASVLLSLGLTPHMLNSWHEECTFRKSAQFRLQHEYLLTHINQPMFWSGLLLICYWVNRAFTVQQFSYRQLPVHNRNRHWVFKVAWGIGTFGSIKRFDGKVILPKTVVQQRVKVVGLSGNCFHLINGTLAKIISLCYLTTYKIQDKHLFFQKKYEISFLSFWT